MPRKAPSPAARRAPFHLGRFLASAGVARTIRSYKRSAVIFSQGDTATDVFYIQNGSVKVSVLSRTGKEALAERFLAHMLARNIRVEEDLVDQLFNSSEKRLARVLLLLARLREGGSTIADPEDVSGDARGNRRHDQVTSELLHEQVPRSRVHRVQRRDHREERAADRCPARVAGASLSGLVIRPSIFPGGNAWTARTKRRSGEKLGSDAEAGARCGQKTTESLNRERDTAVFTIEQYGDGAFRYLHQMSVPLVSTTEEAHAKRWREWQLRNEHGHREGSRRARVVFALIFIVLGLWLGLQLV